MEIIKGFFSLLDAIVYGFIATVYNLITDMTELKIFDSSENFLTSKLYTLLSIFMLFKVSFSFINYLVNPDSFTDKEKGVQKIVMNVVIMFTLLVTSPWAFKQMWNLQDALLKEQVIETLIFEDSESDLKINEFRMWKSCPSEQKSSAASDGDYIALMVLRGFFQLKDANDVPDSGCKVGFATPSDYLLGSDSRNVSVDLKKIDYKIVVSTAVGVVVLLILISFAMEVGLRVIKLSFLQLIAPIPIVSYIDPSSSKNGMFIKWLREVGATWASVFIRLFALFFGVRVIQEIGQEKLTTIDGTEADPGFIITVFLIIGALMFAKQLPKLISDITGFKLDGAFELNPLKKIQKDALGGKELIGGAQRVARGAGGLAIGAGLGIAGAWSANNGTTGQKVGHAAWSALKGAGSGLFGNQKLGDIRKNQADYNRKMDMARGAGATLRGRFGASVAEYLGTPGELGNILVQEQNYDEQIREINTNNINPLKDQIHASQRLIANTQNQIGAQDKIINAGKGVLDTALAEIKANRASKGLSKDYSAEYHRATAELAAIEADYQSNPNSLFSADVIAAERKRVSELEANLVNDFITEMISKGNSYVDANGHTQTINYGLGSALETYNETVNVYGDQCVTRRTAQTTGAEIRQQRGQLSGSNTTLRNNNMRIEAEIETKNRQIKDFEEQKADIQRQKDALQADKRTAQANSDHRIHRPHRGGPGGPRH